MPQLQVQLDQRSLLLQRPQPQEGRLLLDQQRSGTVDTVYHGPLYTVVHALYTVVHALLKTNASSKLKGPVESDDEHKQLFHPTITTGIAPMVVLIYMNVAIFAGESN